MVFCTLKKWMDGVLDHQQPDGGIGPVKNLDWWPNYVMLKALMQYREASGDARVIPLMEKYFAYQPELKRLRATIGQAVTNLPAFEALRGGNLFARWTPFPPDWAALDGAKILNVRVTKVFRVSVDFGRYHEIYPVLGRKGCSRKQELPRSPNRSWLSIV